MCFSAQNTAAHQLRRLILLLLLSESGLLAQGQTSDRKGDEPAWVSSLQDMMVFVDAVQVRVNASNELAEPIKRPLFTYYDAVRKIRDGGIWAWGEGRPVAMAKCWGNADIRRTRAFSLTSEDLVVARGPQSLVWQPSSVQVSPTPLMGRPFNMFVFVFLGV